MRLELRDVHAGYGNVEVLRGVDLVVPTGKTVALLGANGAGKTTLLKVIGGLLRPTKGTVLLDGQPVERASSHARARNGLCLIPEGRAVFPQLTVRENLAMFARGDRAAAIDRAVSAFPVLGDRLNQTAGTMSGGQQQMVAVARAFITDAPVILADELSWGLAPVIVDEIFEAIQVLQSQHRSLLIVEQYVQRILAVAQYVYILHQGSVVFVGEPGQCNDETLFERYLGSVA
jgi:branched-chain amino acid transport system ATP-binding protein